MQLRSTRGFGQVGRIATVSLTLVLASLWQPAGARASPAKPVIVTGAKAGPVNVPGSSTFGTIATLSLGKGAWAVLAKGYLSNGSATEAVATCELDAGPESDQFQANPASGGGS